MYAYRLDIFFPPSLMEETDIDLLTRPPPKASSSNGFSMDYDMSYQDNGGTGLTGFFQPTFFSQAGFLTSGLTYSDFSYEGLVSANLPDGVVRLETTYGRDFPGKLLSVRIGDSITEPGAWGRGVRFAGFQVGTNFSTQPYLITFPLPSIDGTASVPSTVDLYVNNHLVRQADVPIGPFSVRDIPVVTGSGQVQIVVRDVLGREQIIVEDFYASTVLLKKGLSDFSFSAGVMRENFAIESNDYGEFIGELTQRHGVTDSLTLEGHTEFSEDLINAGVTAFYNIGARGVAKTGLALSLDDISESGQLWTLGYQYIRNWFQFNADFQGTSSDFSQLGLVIGAQPPKLQAAVSFGTNRIGAGSLGLSLVRQDFHMGDRRDIATLSYHKSFTRFASVTASTSYINSKIGDDIIASVGFSVPLGELRSVNSFVDYSNGEYHAAAEYRDDPPIGPGYGYRVAAEAGRNDVYEADFRAQNRIAAYSLETRNFDGEFAWRVGTRGSVAHLGGDTYLAREIRDGFAVVELADYENVRVYLENHVVGTTNDHGRILLPGLRPYQTNRLSIEPRDLPMNAHVTKLATVISPYYRSGIMVEFPVSPAQAAIMRVLNQDGDPIRAGAVAIVEGNDEVFPIGNNGMLYLTGIDIPRRVEVKWQGQVCEFEVPVPTGDAPIPNLGDFTCRVTHSL